MKISDLKIDPNNANRGTARGRTAVKESLKRFGAGRSILIDRNGVIIAGNQTIVNATSAGFDDVVVVQSDGTRLIAVQRTDLDITTDAKAKELAVADNRAAELGLEWDPDVLGQLATELDLKPFFEGDEMLKLVAPSLTDDADITSEAAADTEVDVDGFDLEHKCPRCGFEFNGAK